ncbi:hypothetical protein MTO96_043729 [Rhipicephalus appendiculatus]
MSLGFLCTSYFLFLVLPDKAPSTKASRSSPQLKEYYQRFKKALPEYEQVAADALKIIRDMVARARSGQNPPRIAIAYYLLRKYAPESDLYPACYKERARIDQCLAAVSSTVQPRQLMFFRPTFWENKKPTEEEVAAFEENVVTGYQHLVTDKFATGDKLTLADLCLVANLTFTLENGSVDQSKIPQAGRLLRAC